jgi:hypothetical protein
MLTNVCLTLGTCVSSDSVEVVWEWNLGMINLLIVRLERSGIDLRIRVAVDVIKRRCP